VALVEVGFTHYSKIANLGKIRELGKPSKPIVVGVSRKSFLWRITGVNNPVPASLAAEAITVLNGAHVIRTHNPKEAGRPLE
jgi:dihydropteroate synthase